jgi:hypothetical protein
MWVARPTLSHSTCKFWVVFELEACKNLWQMDKTTVDTTTEEICVPE